MNTAHARIQQPALAPQRDLRIVELKRESGMSMVFRVKRSEGRFCIDLHHSVDGQPIVRLSMTESELRQIREAIDAELARVRG
jgi:hypothetical protein